MKLNLLNRGLQRGNVLLMAIIITAIVSVSLASYLSLAIHQQRSVIRSSAWNSAIPVAEAGIEEAMSQINGSIASSSFINNGWQLNGTEYTKVGLLDSDTVFLARVSSASAPVIICKGYVKMPGTKTYITRTVRVKTQSNALFMNGMVAKGQIDLMGNNIESDSFDSDDPNYSTGGLYDSSKRKSNGDIATNSGIVDSLNVGNANIYGRVSTGPGGSIALGDNGSVGDAAWHASGSLGVQPGRSRDDMNISFPPAEAPFTVGLPPLGASVNGTNYSYVLTSGDYSLNSINLSSAGNNRILVTGDARLYVSGDISITGKEAGIFISPNASLKIYAAGQTTRIGGIGVVNESGIAENYQYYGLPSNEKVAFNGNAAYVGTIYAPDADLELGGGGKNQYDFVGASVSNTVKMNGHFNFHYDEALANLNNVGRFKIYAWDEI